MITRLVLVFAMASAGYADEITVPPGDGRTDSTAAFQRALDKVAAGGGGIVRVPAGTYLIEGHLRVPAGVALVGVARAPQSYAPKDPRSTPPPQPGSTLLAVEGAGNAEGEPFLTLAGPNSTVEGLTVFYPRQVKRNPPVPYPWTIRGGGGENIAIINVLLVNPYQAVDLATRPAARHYIRGLYGQPLRKGIWVDQCYDIGRIADVHWWPFWTEDKAVVEYTTTNGVMFILQRTDWEILDGIFVWGYKVGVELSASKHGGMNGQMTNVNLDNVDIGIDAVETQPYVVHIANLNIANAGAGSEHIGIVGRGSRPAELNVRGASFWGRLHQAVRWENEGTFSLADSRVVEWMGEQPAVAVSGGRAMIHHNSFRALKKGAATAIALRPGVKNVLVEGNQLNGHRLQNEAGAAAMASGNQP